MNNEKTNTWKEIWTKSARLNDPILECMIKADGFDTAASKFDIEDWRRYVSNIYKYIGIKKDISVYDVGCGSGAFLYQHHLNGGKVGGCDYSPFLLKIANAFMDGTFEEIDAKNLSTDIKWDVIVSNSTFQYFENKEIAYKITSKMMEKANNAIAILDVNDVEFEDVYHENRIEEYKRANLSEKDYWNKYDDLKHQFYPKKFFTDFGIKHNLKTEIYSQNINGYKNSKLRYNVFFRK